MSTEPRVGFIGVGLMGHGMAKNILQAGYDLTIMGHKNRKPVKDLVKRGASEAKTAAALAKASDIIFICVSSSQQVEELVRGKNGPPGLAMASLVSLCGETASRGSIAPGGYDNAPVARGHRGGMESETRSSRSRSPP